MTTNSLSQSDVILTDVEAFFEALPEKRRRKRTHEEIYNPDQSPESENYNVLSPFDALCAGRPAKSATSDRIDALLLAWEIKGRIRAVSRMAGKAGRLAGSYDGLCQLVDQLLAIANGKGLVGVDVVPAFLALPFERKRMIVYAMSGLLFDTEAQIVSYMNQPDTDGE